MTVNSNNAFNQIIQKTQVASKPHEINETNEISIFPKEVYEMKNSLGEERYDSLAINGWFENTVFEKDEKLREEFKNHLGEMSKKEFSMTLFSMISNFTPGMVENDDLKPLHLAPIQKDPKVELSSLSSTTSYFKANYNTIIENVNKWGGDATEALNTVSNLINFFQKYESEQQKELYLSFGKAK